MARWPSSGSGGPETDPVASAALDAHKAAATDAHGGIVAADDVRLADPRVPTAHRLSHGSAGVDPLSPADIAAVSTGDARLTDARTPTAHGHVIADTTGLQTGLDGKVGTSDTRLSDARTPLAHGHPQSDVTGLGTSLAAKADLVNGTVPTAQIPAVATGQTVTVVSQAAMLALTPAQVQPGDVAIRSDQAGRRWVLAADDPALLGSWIALEVPDAVSSVNSQQGAVILGKADVGLGSVDNTADAAKPVSVAQQAALDAKAALAHGHAIADTAGLQAGLDAKAPLASPSFTGTLKNTVATALKWEAFTGATQMVAIRSDDATNLGVGAGALQSNTVTGVGIEGLYNAAFGTEALRFNTTGRNNVAVGSSALYSNTTGASNVVVGSSALYANTTGAYNVAFGTEALRFNTTGGSNVAVGSSALYSNTTGVGNIGLGNSALYSNTTGVGNTAVGLGSLGANTTGGANVAVGNSALYSNTTGTYNTAAGRDALYSNTTGTSNTAAGGEALYSNTTGSSNTAAGVSALYAPGGVVANATTTALRQTAIGSQSGQASATQVNDVLAAGYRALVGAADTVALGSGAQALHTGSVALGKGAVTTAADQVMVGARDVEITASTKGVVLRSPGGARYRLTVANGGALTAVAA